MLNAGQVSAVRRDAWRARPLSLPTVGNSAFAYRARKENRRAGVRSSPVGVPISALRRASFDLLSLAHHRRPSRRKTPCLTDNREVVRGGWSDGQDGGAVGTAAAASAASVTKCRAKRKIINVRLVRISEWGKWMEETKKITETRTALDKQNCLITTIIIIINDK